MNSRQLCTIVVRGIGLWLTLTWFPTVVWRVGSVVRHYLGADQVGAEPFDLGTTAFYGADLLVFLIGAWMLIDGKELIGTQKGTLYCLGEKK